MLFDRREVVTTVFVQDNPRWVRKAGLYHGLVLDDVRIFVQKGVECHGNSSRKVASFLLMALHDGSGIQHYCTTTVLTIHLLVSHSLLQIIPKRIHRAVFSSSIVPSQSVSCLLVNWGWASCLAAVVNQLSLYSDERSKSHTWIGSYSWAGKRPAGRWPILVAVTWQPQAMASSAQFILIGAWKAESNLRRCSTRLSQIRGSLVDQVHQLRCQIGETGRFGHEKKTDL